MGTQFDSTHSCHTNQLSVFGTLIRMDPEPHNGWIRIQFLEGKNDTKIEVLNVLFTTEGFSLGSFLKALE
jgi:hypothetical protein